MRKYCCSAPDRDCASACGPHRRLRRPRPLRAKSSRFLVTFKTRKTSGKAGLLCALATVKYEGNPVGTAHRRRQGVSAGGRLVANNNARLVPLLSHTVTVTGEVTRRPA